MRRLSIEEEEILMSHVCCPGLKYAKEDTIKHWMTMQTRIIMSELGMAEKLEGKWRIVMKDHRLKLHIDPQPSSDGITAPRMQQ